MHSINDSYLVRYNRLDGRTAPRTAAMDTFRWGSGGTSLGEWEHNNRYNRYIDYIGV